jgi:acetylornithine deacetylase/succinyl-diaminopimelate desuccinylase-like protein
VEAQATNSIPTEARASIDLRLVPDQTPEKMRALVEKHVQKQGFHIVRDTPDVESRRRHAKIVKMEWGSGYPAKRTSMDLPISRAVTRVLEETNGAPIVQVPTLGGSVPIYIFDQELHVPVVGVPIVNHDNNQHAADENLRVQNLWDGIDYFAALMARLGVVWE